MAGLTHEI